MDNRSRMTEKWGKWPVKENKRILKDKIIMNKKILRDKVWK